MATKPTKIPDRHIRLTLLDVEPAVWRRIAVPGHWHLGRVHDVLQVAMGWQDCHLHEFEAGGRRIGPPDPYGESGATRETVVRLHEVMTHVGAVMTYTYDYGDGWVHELAVEALLGPLDCAGCTAGANACPPEDCGGPWGYVEMLMALADPTHDDHEHFGEWIGDDFDPVAFDQRATDLALSRIR